MIKYKVIVNDNYTAWYNSFNKLHRIGGPALIYNNGDIRYYINGFLHRDDGPAVIFYDGDCQWYNNGILHRVNGPAIKTKYISSWYINGVKIK